MARKFSNVSKTMALTSSVTIADVQLHVDDASGLPQQFPYVVVIDYEQPGVEICLVTAAAGNILTVERGQEDTAAQPHTIGSVVVHAATAQDLQQAADHREATSNVHGVGAGSDVVGTDTVQTLTGKTMSGLENTFTDLPSNPIDTLPASKVTSPFTAPMTFQENVTWEGDANVVNGNVAINQATSGVGLTVTADPATTADAARFIGTPTARGLVVRRNNATATGANLFEAASESGAALVSMSRAGALTAVGAVKGASVIQAGTPDRSLGTETVLRFANAADRTAQLVGAMAPVAGMLTYLVSPGVYEFYNGTAFVNLGTVAGGIAKIPNTAARPASPANGDMVFQLDIGMFGALIRWHSALSAWKLAGETLIWESTVGTAVQSVDTGQIPQIGKHLRLLCSSRSTNTPTQPVNGITRINGRTDGVYNMTYFDNDHTAGNMTDVMSTSALFWANILHGAAGVNSSVFGTTEMLFTNYSTVGRTIFMQARSMSGDGGSIMMSRTSQGLVLPQAMLSPINSIQIWDLGALLAVGSQFSLYALP